MCFPFNVSQLVYTQTKIETNLKHFVNEIVVRCNLQTISDFVVFAYM